MWLCGFRKDINGSLYWKGDSFDTTHCTYIRKDCVREFTQNFSNKFEQVYKISDSQFNNYNFSFTMENIIKNGVRIK